MDIPRPSQTAVTSSAPIPPMSLRSQPTERLTPTPNPTTPAPSTTDDGWDFDEMMNIVTEDKKLRREIDHERHKRQVLEEQVRDLAPLTPLLPSVKRLEALGFQGIYFSSMLEIWVDVANSHRPDSRIARNRVFEEVKSRSLCVARSGFA